MGPWNMSLLETMGSTDFLVPSLVEMCPGDALVGICVGHETGVHERWWPFGTDRVKCVHMSLCPSKSLWHQRLSSNSNGHTEVSVMIKCLTAPPGTLIRFS